MLAPPLAILITVALITGSFGVLALMRRRTQTTLRRMRGESGQGLVEMAILLPMLLVLVVGIVEIANGLNAYITVVNSARDGARIAAKGNADDAAIQSLVNTELEDLQSKSTDVDVKYVVIDGVDAVEVTACHDHELILGVTLVMPESYRMCSRTAMRLID
jgi:Flp pilus assembly protein TadG